MGLSHILEPAGIARGGDAVFVIGVDVGDIARAVGGRDHAAALVGVEVTAVG